MRVWISVAAASLAAVVGAGLAFAQDAAAPPIERQVPQTNEQIQLSFAPLVRKASPAVVNVYARQLPATRDETYWQQFGNSPRVRQSLGSGVIVDPSGIVVTNLHVIDEANDIRVAFADGREMPAEIVLTEELFDLAILRIPAMETPYPFLSLADSDLLAVGDLVLAIGNPFGVGQTVTSGIVSALGRTLAGGDETQVFIQTDAAINPGNSGGALIDVLGNLIGINTAIFSRGGGSDGIGFAIPSNVVEIVLDAALNGAHVKRPWIGAGFGSLTFETAQELGLAQLNGARVTYVLEDGPAATAGLAVDDVVVTFDGIPIDHPTGLTYRLLVSGIGHEATLGILRGGRPLELTITAAEALETVPREELVITGRTPFTGAGVANLSPAVAQELGYAGVPEGVIVVNVAASSFAASSGLERGDVIVALNGTAIESTQQLRDLVAAGANEWRTEIVRGGRTLRSTLSIGR
ncbi:MAG: trypsin-like peptidase domain-containing protein [Bauldia sp.]|nr:trypsin-like peptidase domain-containing protein [Bauldia sp.]